MLLLVIVICFFLFFKMKQKKPQSMFKADIVFSPGGYYGMYTLGVCHYIKNNYDIKDKTKLGFSSGSFNALFMSMDKSKDHLFLKKLFEKKLKPPHIPSK